MGCFVVNFDKISHTVKVEENQIVESAEVMDELAAKEDFQLIRAATMFPIGKSIGKPCYRRFKTDTELLIPRKQKEFIEGDC